MLTISPPLFSYPLGDLRRHEQNGSYHGETETSESLLNSPTFQQQVGQNHESHQFSSVNDQSKTVKKLNHNASERDRRKRINGLYSSLRSLLPPAYQEKKLSIPSTVSRVLKYIPELQKEVESLIEKKECLKTRISEQENSSPLRKQRNLGSSTQIPSSTVSASRLSDREVMVQISTMKFSKCSYADVLSSLEQDGFFSLNSSCFESFGERVFHSLHLEIRGTPTVDLEGLRKKLLSFYSEKLEEQSILSF
ncbi:transcription factor bHLH100 [Coffea arabica]|uniref:Transcription factor bHLH100 n=1 Tax=Coffea arabica TaxID=13443 RepID=A0A6P6SU74_COFAR|nr:transcription factor bHLH100-like [Coffea arabica]